MVVCVSCTMSKLLNYCDIQCIQEEISKSIRQIISRVNLILCLYSWHIWLCLQLDNVSPSSSAFSDLICRYILFLPCVNGVCALCNYLLNSAVVIQGDITHSIHGYMILFLHPHNPPICLHYTAVHRSSPQLHTAE